MIIIKDKKNQQVYEMTDTGDRVNVDVLDWNGEVEYGFYISKESMLELLEGYQKSNNII